MADYWPSYYAGEMATGPSTSPYPGGGGPGYHAEGPETTQGFEAIGRWGAEIEALNEAYAHTRRSRNQYKMQMDRLQMIMSQLTGPSNWVARQLLGNQISRLQAQYNQSLGEGTAIVAKELEMKEAYWAATTPALEAKAQAGEKVQKSWAHPSQALAGYQEPGAEPMPTPDLITPMPWMKPYIGKTEELIPFGAQAEIGPEQMAQLYGWHEYVKAGRPTTVEDLIAQTAEMGPVWREQHQMKSQSLWPSAGPRRTGWLAAKQR